MDVSLAIGSVLGSCCGCMIFVEYLAREDAGSMNLMTFSTFLFISIEGLISQSRFGQVKNLIPLRAYAELVVIFFLVSVVNNQALNFHVPVPLHIIFRSGSLITNLLLGMWILQKRYSFSKYLSVVLVTAGIVVCTLAAATVSEADADSDKAVSSEAPQFRSYLSKAIGISMLTFALFASSLLGVRQEQLFTKYGKHNREAMFYIHVLSLPGFLFMASDIYKHVLIFNESESVLLPILNIGLPRLWIFLLVNDVAQYVCIRSVYKLTAECASLTVTLVLTLRKFLSLIVSILYFGNAFTPQHWLGTALVFGGTLVFADVPRRIGHFFQKQKSQ